MHAVNATIASGKPLFAVAYRDSADSSHEKVQGNLMLVQDKGAHPLKSTGIDDAIFQIENKHKTSLQPVQPSLFD
mgnify:FL=1